MVVIEAMTCGFPVTVRRRGSVSEIIGDGIAGFVVGELLQPVAEVRRLSRLGHRHTRRVFDERFSVRRMA